MSSVPPSRNESVSSSPPELQGFLGKRIYQELERAPDIGLPKNKWRDSLFVVVRYRKCLWLAFLVGVGLLFVALWPDQVNFENFRKIDKGMTENDAERIFGEPARDPSILIVYGAEGIPHEVRSPFKNWIGWRFKVRVQNGMVIDKWETRRVNSSYIFRKLGHFLIGVAIGIVLRFALRTGTEIARYVNKLRRWRQRQAGQGSLLS
jgi:hypothetical protein